MAINPLRFAHEVQAQYLRYQLTSYRLADEELWVQLKDLIWSSQTKLLKGPYLSLSREFASGPTVQSLVDDGVFHKGMARIAPFPHLYRHQWDALQAVKDGHDVLVTTGTGSGKTESFLYPIFDRCLRLRDTDNPRKGVTAILVYPMNALANDQLERLRGLLAGTGITYGLYTGDTKNDESKLEGVPKRAPKDADPETYRKLAKETWERSKGKEVLIPAEERLTREEIRDDPPRILITNSTILEFNLTRAKDIEIFQDAPLEFVVLDEAHTNTGAKGAEIAMLLRRLKSLASPPENRICHIATSATIVDESHENEGQRFLSRLFGTDEANVRVVRESYKEVQWPETRVRTKPPADPSDTLQRVLGAVDEKDPKIREDALQAAFKELTRMDLPAADTIETRLFKGLKQTDMAYWIHERGAQVQEMNEFIPAVWRACRRDGLPGNETRDELLAYLALGAAAEQEGTPLLRPKLHYFIKGLDGAGVVLEADPGPRKIKPHLYLSCEEAREDTEGRIEPTGVFPVVGCPQCGQHHYVQYLKDLQSAPGEEVAGGIQHEGGRVFQPDPDQMAESKVFFTDNIVIEDDEDEPSQGVAKKYIDGIVCPGCGALHTDNVKSCGFCEKDLPLLPVRILNSVQTVKSCPSCRYSRGAAARRYKDPFRAIREVQVANVHVLAQDMLNQADEQGRRLIVFADNRQEAAFQAGWMRDRARRYRFRQVLYQTLVQDKKWSSADPQNRPDISLGSIVDRLFNRLKENVNEARLLAPEVFQDQIVESFSRKVEDELRRFLVIQVMREISASYKTRASLEAWGRLHVHYAGLTSKHDGVQNLAARYNLSAHDLTNWLEVLLDKLRRSQVVHDKWVGLFSRYWDDRYDLEHNKFLPPIKFNPVSYKLEYAVDEEKRNQVKPFRSNRRTGISDWLRGLLLEKDQEPDFLGDVWNLLTEDLGLLTSIEGIQNSRGNGVLPGTANTYQLDAHKIGLTTQARRWECRVCHTIYSRPTTNDVCARWLCKEGKVTEKVEEEPRDYDQVYLDEAEVMTMAEEHTAQVPSSQRADIERQFKEPMGGVNCLVATPTLELGVDIGALDFILMRNVPPTPANYWQRAGRAGRRHRMAVLMTYASGTAHDGHFFEEPQRILGGAVRPPRFNLRNPVMVRKHVHAAVLTELHLRMRNEEENWLGNVFPGLIGDVLFEGKRIRQSVTEAVDPLRRLLAEEDFREGLARKIHDTFLQHWPEEDREEVNEDRLREYIAHMPDQLEATYDRLLKRLKWAEWQVRRLLDLRIKEGALASEEERFLRRCEDTIRSMRPIVSDKPEQRKKGLQNYTLSVLSREGFLPGHAQGTDQVVAAADQAYTSSWKKFDFELARPATLAIREHIPGNMVYANGGKYKVTYYRFPAQEELKDPPLYHISGEHQAARPADTIGAGYQDEQGAMLPALPIVDSMMSFISHVDDEDTHRFRMPSTIRGVLRRQHKGGDAYEVADREIHHRKGQHITLVNIGPTSSKDDALGFPLCPSCGGCRSPFDSEDAIKKFADYHKKSCDATIGWYGFYAQAQVDGLLIFEFEHERDAVNLGEALCVAASHSLDMNRDDLAWFTTLDDDEEHWGLFLYDPMPGGSGLLQQILERWEEILKGGMDILKGCPNGCPTSCYECLRTYFNQVHHDDLDRREALGLLEVLGVRPKHLNKIEPMEEQPESVSDPTNLPEKRLERTLMDWGMTGFEPQADFIELNRINDRTQPDLFHPEKKICIFLDGSIHNDPVRRQQDKRRRNELRKMGYKVTEVDVGDLDNEKILQMIREEVQEYLGGDGSR